MRTRLERFSIVDRLLDLIERQRPSDRLILRILFFVIIGSGIFLLLTLNDKYSMSVPADGGEVIEGIVGIPRFVNPALALTRADQDTVALVYSGLLRSNSTGNLEPDLAESVTISDDGLIYHVILKKDNTFHDGKPLTARDVVFTFDLFKNPILRSPLQGVWSDVAIEEINEYELNIILKEAYAPFIENLTVGVMPYHIWGDLPIEQLPFSQYNTEPIGSGLFAIKDTKHNSSGLISSYELSPTSKIALDKMELRFYPNENDLTEAFLNKEITNTVFLPTNVISELDPEAVQIISEPLPRIFGIFFNQNKSPALRDKAARQALNVAIDREQIVNEVLGGHGVPTNQPILISANKLESINTDSDNRPTSSIALASEILIKGGWTQSSVGLWEKEIDKSKETLSVTIRTSNTEIFDKTTAIVAENWRKLGVEVQIEQYEQTGLVKSVIRPRDFQALLFGLDMNRIQDLYPFWHSSQKDDPGLNITQYTNVTVDQLLEKSRVTKDDDERNKILSEISDIIVDELPAIFLFAPNVTYVVNKDIQITPINSFSKPTDRFTDIANWHTKSEKIWSIFE
ncbi:MAG: hypothetical protein H6779_05270 [Candidatus Nomurabacteria bacterium]|nr:MAG: hypothetical protein H6779_05270 [Candidatus Nomurabacteria bacterium]